MKRTLRNSPHRSLPALAWSVLLIFAMGFALPSIATAAQVDLADINKVSIAAFRDNNRTTLLQRVYVSEDIPLPCTVTLQWPGNGVIASSKQSDGDDWWGLSTTLSGGKITYTLTKGRIAEFECLLGDIYKPDGNAIIAAVPVVLAKGINSVEVGCSVLEGYVCVYPDTYRTDFRTGTYEEVVITAVDLSGETTRDEVLFGFEPKATAGKSGSSTTAPLDLSQLKDWPWMALLLLVLAIIFAAIVTYIISRTSEDEHPDPEDLTEGESAPEDQPSDAVLDSEGDDHTLTSDTSRE